MPNKSLKYFLSTLRLKIIAQGSFVLDKLGMMESMKQSNRELIEKWLIGRDAEPTYIPNYLAYGFIKDEKQLEKLLQFDENGIPIGWKHAKPTAHNPLMIGYMALVYWNNQIRGDMPNNEKRFLELASFLAKYGVIKKNGYWLPYLQSVPRLGLSTPWYSGLAHAVALSVFIRAFEVTADKHYKNLADQLCNTLTTPTQEGGFLELLPGGGYWIQEYPTDKIKQVLNGLLFCLIGLYEHQLKLGGNQMVRKVLNDCEATFFHWLPKYLVGKYTRYAFGKPTFSNIEYQGLFVFLFLHLYRLSGKHVYHKLADRFNKYTDWDAFFLFYEIEDHKGRIPILRPES
jgi:hypothetical protein